MTVTINLDDELAIVLFELLQSKKLLSVVDIPERNALWALDCLLESQMVTPFKPDYRELLEAARKAMIDRGGS
jgi:hypothetical protein